MTDYEKEMAVELRIIASFFVVAIPLILCMIFTPHEYNIWSNQEAYPGWNQWFWIIGIIFSIIVSYKKDMVDGWTVVASALFGPIYGLMILSWPLIFKYFPIKKKLS